MTRKNFIAVSLLSFGIFFGAGNLIFPPAVAQQAGTNIWYAFGGFFITAVLLPVLGIVSVAKTDGLLNLGKKVDPIFAYIVTIGILIAIGPGLAIPRTASTSFQMAITPYLGRHQTSQLPLILYSFLYFLLVGLVSWSPNKIVERIGKITTPALLFLIFIMTALVFKQEKIVLLTPVDGYKDSPIVTGFLAGYNTLDTLAALNYGLLIVTAIRAFNVPEGLVTRIATKTGIFAGAVLTFVYFGLTLIGQVGASAVDSQVTGADILVASSIKLLGSAGTIVLGMIFVLACFNTCVGLVTSISQFFNQILPFISYRGYILILSIWSFALANIGLAGILTYSVPILLLLYPVAISLIILSLTEKLLGNNTLTYRMVAYTVSLISVISSLDHLAVKIPVLTHLVNALPWASNGLHWVLPMMVTLLAATLFNKLNRTWA